MTTAFSTDAAFPTEQVQPFIESLRHLFVSHLGGSLEVGDPIGGDATGPVHDIAGVVSFAGTMEGRVIVSMPRDVATRLTCDYLSVESVSEEMLMDCVGEITNIVVGRAKADLADHIVIAPPSVVSGDDRLVTDGTGACVTVSCTSGYGPVRIDVKWVTA